MVELEVRDGEFASVGGLGPVGLQSRARLLRETMRRVLDLRCAADVQVDAVKRCEDLMGMGHGRCCVQ